MSKKWIRTGFVYTILLILLACTITNPFSNGHSGDTETPESMALETTTPQSLVTQDSTEYKETSGGETATPKSEEELVDDGSSWIRAFGMENDMFGTQIVPVKDGYILAGYVVKSPVHLFVMKVDLAGDSLWQYQYTFNCQVGSEQVNFREATHVDGVYNFSFWVELTTTSDGGVLVALDTFVVHLNAEGEKLWSANYMPLRNTYPFTISSMLELDDGYLLAGNFDFYMYEPVHLDDIVLIRTDLQGQMLWTYQYAGTGGDKSASTNWPNPWTLNTVEMKLTPDGKNVILGTYTIIKKSETGKHNTAALVMKLDLAGEVLWTQAIELTQKDSNGNNSNAYLWPYNRFLGLDTARNGDILLLQGTANELSNQTVLSRLDAGGSILWSRQIHSKYHNGDTVLTEIKENTKTGELYTVGYGTEFQQAFSPPTLQNRNVILAKFTADGDPLWVNSIGKLRFSNSIYDHASEVAFDIAFTPLNGIMVVGAANGFNFWEDWHEMQAPDHYDLLLIKTNPAGLVNDSGQLISSVRLGERSDLAYYSPKKTIHTLEIQPTEESVFFETCSVGRDGFLLDERSFDVSLPMDTIVQDHGRTILTNQSIFVDADQDMDGDGINQDLENALLQDLRPIFELDEEETWLDNIESNPVVYFVRVTPYPDQYDPEYILFLYSISWAMDYGGGPQQIESQIRENHRGDNEAVILAYHLTGNRRLDLEWVFTSAHGAVNNHSGVWHAFDRSCNRGYISDKDSNTVGSELECASLIYNKNSPFLQASENKHAIYPTIDICEDVVLVAVLGDDNYLEDFGEDCGYEPWLHEAFFADFEDDEHYLGNGLWQFDAYNMGEPDTAHQLVDDLDDSTNWLGLTDEQEESLNGLFPHEAVWSGNDEKPSEFCGGENAPPPNCCGAVAVRLTSLPSEMEEALSGSAYRVEIETSNQALAGTDGVVYLTLHGTKGDLHEFVDGSFEKGDKDVFHFGDAYQRVGELLSITLSLEGGSVTSDWHVGKVHILDTISLRTYTFNVDDWVKEGHPVSVGLE